MTNMRVQGESPSIPTVIYVSSRDEEKCGVYQFGKNIAEALRKSLRFRFVPRECADRQELVSAISELSPSAVVYNYHPATMPWLTSAVTRQIKCPQVGTVHECPQDIVDRLTNDLFDFHIAPDPTLLLKNPYLFTTGRLIPRFENHYPMPAVPTIGSFGFGLAGKGFDRLIRIVQEEYSDAHIRLHIPFSPIMDPDGSLAEAMRRDCEQLITKPGIRLSLSHEFLSQDAMLGFLAQNTINAFFYDTYPNRGLSSSVDYALAVNRPIALSRSDMFRHLRVASPPIDIEQTSLREIVANGIKPLQRFQRDWTEDNLIWDYERIVDKALTLWRVTPWHRGIVNDRVKRKLRRIAARSTEDPPVIGPGATWLQADVENPSATLAAFASNEPYRASLKHGSERLNRILDDRARAEYEEVINELFRLSPEILERKIPRANVQQAFVLHTVHGLASQRSSEAKILCVGSYEDSAAAGLKRLGHPLDEIDPLLNYDLSEFVNRPSVRANSYDVIFSTSVIEHVRDDLQFLQQIASLLAPGGTAVLTADYLDQFKEGDRLPPPDFRFYTQQDFRERLLPSLPNCELVDGPDWDCEHPDFNYGGFCYTFATLVFRKKR